MRRSLKTLQFTQKTRKYIHVKTTIAWPHLHKTNIGLNFKVFQDLILAQAMCRKFWMKLNLKVNKSYESFKRTRLNRVVILIQNQQKYAGHNAMYE